VSRLHLLVPGVVEIGDLTTHRADTLAALADLYAYPDPPPADGWVRASMVSTVDGAAAGPDGLSKSIGNEVDRAALSTMRGLADVVLVGAGTVRAERYAVPVPKPEFAEHRARRGMAAMPVMAVVSRSATLTGAVADLFAEPGRAILVTTRTADTTALRARLGDDGVVVAGERDVDVHAAVSALGERGLRRVLLEGGPSLLAAALAQGRVDEICQTITPMAVAGEAPRIAHGPATRVGLRLAHLVMSDSTLLGRWLVHTPGNGSADV
jgi:riboflavin biosynthesis pyrimidine reductase